MIGYWTFNELSGTTVNDNSQQGYNGQFVNTPNRVFSGAPIGDESISFYQPNWTGGNLNASFGANNISITDISGNPQGFQLYAVNSMPSQTAGLESVGNVDSYIGIFSASLTPSAKFTSALAREGVLSCKHYARKDNSISTWLQAGQEEADISDRAELIGSFSESLEFDLGPDREDCQLRSVVLEPLMNPQGYQFTWQDGSTNSFYEVKDYGTYWVTVESDCIIAQDTITFVRPEKGDGFIPNVFTPNGDDKNARFEVAAELIGSQLVVYNRWGKEVYQSKHYENQWDGGSLPAGVYFYRLEGPCIEPKKGWVYIAY